LLKLIKMLRYNVLKYTRLLAFIYFEGL
jgi:hypothetical protein